MLKRIKDLFFRRPRPRRSVVFYRHSYYHFYYLAKELRKRGWEAITVNLESPDGVNANYYHGEDINLYDSDPVQYDKNISEFFSFAKSRFKLMHFAGDGYLTFYPKNESLSDPKDIIAWKKIGNKIAYTISGCNSATFPSSVLAWSSLDNGKEVCEKCVWQHNSDVCSMEKSKAWGDKVSKYCDFICAETLPALDYLKAGNNIIREPLSMCLDHNFWSPDLIIPEKFKINRAENEVLIYHAVGNYDTRNSGVRNIKGTPAIFSAVEKLKAEGYPVKLIFFTNMKNTEIRFMQAQADIIVDQLNMGRYGATAREGMMLGKPVICYMNPREFNVEDELISLKECPLISATEETIYEVLKHLINNKSLLKEVGKKSREYCLKWHSAEQCAIRYEKVYDKFVSSGDLFL